MIEIGFEEALFIASHGIYTEESILKHTFKVDLSCMLNSNDFIGNDLDNSVSYAELYSIVDEVMKTPEPLLEAVSENIIKAIKLRFPEKIAEIKLQIKKLNPPINGRVKSAFVKYSIKL